MEGTHNILEEYKRRKRFGRQVMAIYITVNLICLVGVLIGIGGMMADPLTDFQARIFAVRDHNGTVDYDIARLRSDDIFIDALQKENGEYVSFESDAYHLEGWCEEHGFDYFEDEISIPVYVRFE